jgi:broad specificity phosphatase PhoE
MTKICLIRHGQTDWNKSLLIQGRIDNCINSTGIEQARETGKYLRGHDAKWDVIMCSPLSRTIQTAEIIAQELGYKKPIIINPDVIERDFGAADGLTISEEVYDRIVHDDYEGLEKAKDLQARALKAMEDIEKHYSGQRVLIITHSHFIKGLFTTLDPDIRFTSTLYNGSLCYVTVENGNIHSPVFNMKAETEK